jgi:tRNA(Ile2) C34 agmatinyltransferase TiaS
MEEAAEGRARQAAVWTEVEAALAAWHTAHPDASLAEIEAAVEQELSRLRTHLLHERVTTLAEATERARPGCPQCGTPLQRRGRRARTLTGRGGAPLRVERQYYECPACGSGLFPPG